MSAIDNKGVLYQPRELEWRQDMTFWLSRVRKVVERRPRPTPDTLLRWCDGQTKMPKRVTVEVQRLCRSLAEPTNINTISTLSYEIVGLRQMLVAESENEYSDTEGPNTLMVTTHLDDVEAVEMKGRLQSIEQGMADFNKRLVVDHGRLQEARGVYQQARRDNMVDALDMAVMSLLRTMDRGPARLATMLELGVNKGDRSAPAPLDTLCIRTGNAAAVVKLDAIERQLDTLLRLLLTTPGPKLPAVAPKILQEVDRLYDQAGEVTELLGWRSVVYLMLLALHEFASQYAVDIILTPLGTWYTSRVVQLLRQFSDHPREFLEWHLRMRAEFRDAIGRVAPPTTKIQAGRRDIALDRMLDARYTACLYAIIKTLKSGVKTMKLAVVALSTYSEPPVAGLKATIARRAGQPATKRYRNEAGKPVAPPTIVLMGHVGKTGTVAGDPFRQFERAVAIFNQGLEVDRGRLRGALDVYRRVLASRFSTSHNGALYMAVVYLLRTMDRGPARLATMLELVVNKGDRSAPAPLDTLCIRTVNAAAVVKLDAIERQIDTLLRLLLTTPGPKLPAVAPKILQEMDRLYDQAGEVTELLGWRSVVNLMITALTDVVIDGASVVAKVAVRSRKR